MTAQDQGSGPGSLRRYLFDDVPKMVDEIQRLSADLAAAYAALKAIDEHVTGMDSEIGDHQDRDYDRSDPDDVYAAGHTMGRYAEHEKITRELWDLLDSDAVRLAAGVTCQPGQPWSCGDAHTAGHCVRTVSAPAAAQANAHECMPTQDAYDRACAALWKHRGRADALAAAVSEVAGVAENIGHDALPAGPARSALLGLATRLRDAQRVDEAALKELPRPVIDDLIARSSLGTPGAVALRATTDEARAARVAAQASVVPQTDDEPQDWWWDGTRWHAVPAGQRAPKPDEQAFITRLRAAHAAFPNLTAEQVAQALGQFHARLATPTDGSTPTDTTGGMQ